MGSSTETDINTNTFYFLKKIFRNFHVGGSSVKINEINEVNASSFSQSFCSGTINRVQYNNKVPTYEKYYHKRQKKLNESTNYVSVTFLFSTFGILFPTKLNH